MTEKCIDLNSSLAEPGFDIATSFLVSGWFYYGGGAASASGAEFVEY